MALGELGLRMHDFYNMPFNEFIIKVESYRRIEGDRNKADILNYQFVAYHAFIAGNIRLDKIPSFKEFIGEEEEVVPTLTEYQREKLKAATAEYLKKKNKIS